MITSETYTCEICSEVYYDREQALQCEATVMPPKPEHLIGKTIRAKHYGTEGVVQSIGIRSCFGSHEWILFTGCLMKDSDHYPQDDSPNYIELGGIE